MHWCRPTDTKHMAHATAIPMLKHHNLQTTGQAGTSSRGPAQVELHMAYSGAAYRIGFSMPVKLSTLAGSQSQSQTLRTMVCKAHLQDIV